MGKLNDLSGQRFGRLTVLQRDGSFYHAKGNRPRWLCLCDCGNLIYAETTHLKTGNTKSCGCLHREQVADRNAKSAKHGAKRNGDCERLYRIWGMMKRRCYDKSGDAYQYYGMRGITVCDEWKDDYTAFKEWAINHGYSDELSIDRINTNGKYSPENCRWVNAEVQANNRSNNILLTHNGRTQTIAQWSRETGLSYRAIHARYKAGWEVQKILEYPNKRKFNGGIGTKP